MHPTSTAGDGRRLKTGLHAPGTPQDRYRHCAQCGFLFNDDKYDQGDSEESPGITHPAVVVTISNTQELLPRALRDLSTFSATSKTVTDAVVTSGCPLCGTHNPQGRNRFDNEPRGVDLSDQ